MYDKRCEETIRAQDMYFQEMSKKSSFPRSLKKSFEVIINFDDNSYILSKLSGD